MRATTTTTTRAGRPTALLGPRATPDTRGIAEQGNLRDRPILLATDGGTESRAASRLTSALARERGARPIALRALEYILSPRPHIIVDTPNDLSEYDALDVAEHQLRAQLVRDVDDAATWEMHVVAGRPARSIADEAVAAEAALIVMGLHRQRALDHPLRNETALHVASEGGIPVLATTGALSGLPHRVVTGIDCGRAGTRAARAAVAVLADHGTLVLAFVQSSEHAPGELSEGDRTARRDGIAEVFDGLRQELEGPQRLQVETVVLEGPTASALGALADRAHADLIAVGSQRHDMVQRFFLGSVPTALMREGNHSVLIVPPRRAPQA